MSNLAPLVSIGVPVFNSETTIKAALDSLISQTYSNIEIIISDNASTDLTTDICREYALRDDRIVFFQQTENLGVTHNFDFVLKASRGEYFMWAAGDDVRSKDYISINVKYLIDNPGYVVSTSLDNLFTSLENLNTMFHKKHKNYSLEGSMSDRCKFFFEIDLLPHGLFYGLFRSDVIKKCPYVSMPLPLIWAWDWTISLYIMTVGKINISEEGFTTFGTRETNPTAIIWPPGWWQLFPFYKFSKVALRITRGFGLRDKLNFFLILIDLNLRNNNTTYAIFSRWKRIVRIFSRRG